MDTIFIEADIKNFISSKSLDNDLLSRVIKAFGLAFYNEKSNKILFSDLIIDNSSQQQIERLVKKIDPDLQNIFINFVQLKNEIGVNKEIYKIALVYLIVKNKLYNVFENPIEVQIAKRKSAAKLLLEDYEMGKELTSFTALDKEDFYEAG